MYYIYYNNIIIEYICKYFFDISAFILKGQREDGLKCVDAGSSGRVHLLCSEDV